MRVLRLATALAVMAGMFCGGQQQADQSVPVKDGLPAVAFERIGEEEMDKLAAALPDVGEALRAAGFSPGEDEDDEIPEALARFVNGMERVPGVDAALVKHNTNWQEFSATMYKIMAASAALGLDVAVAMAEGFADDSEEGRHVQAEVAKAKAFCEKVPQENRQMLMENMARLEALGELN